MVLQREEKEVHTARGRDVILREGRRVSWRGEVTL